MQKINLTRFRQADYQRTVWHATAEAGMIPDDLLEPAAWGNVAQQFQPYHRVEVASDDGTWWAEYLVVDCDRLWAKVHLLRKVEMGAVPDRAAQQADYRIINRGVKKWSVVRNGDNAVIKDGFATRDDAETHLVAHIKATAA